MRSCGGRRPFGPLRAIIGSAAFSAAAAASLLPEAIASSTLRTELLQPGAPCLVDGGAADGLTGGFLRRFGISHDLILERRASSR